MKVLVVHNFHRSGSASGDDQVFKHETAMLKNAGIELLRYTIHTCLLYTSDAADE